MNRDILNKIDALLEDKDNIPVDQLEVLVDDMLAFFNDVSVILNEGTEEEKKEAVALMFEIQVKFRELGLIVAKKMGLESEQLNTMLNPKNFFPNQWKNIEDIRKEIDGQDKEV